jgi:hypothetical protein
MCMGDRAFQSFVESELLRLKDLKFSLLWRQMSDSVLDSKILEGLQEAQGSCHNPSFCAKRILPQNNMLLKSPKIAANAEVRLDQLNQAANPASNSTSLSILVKPGENQDRPTNRRVTFVLESDHVGVPAPRVKEKPRSRANPITPMDYEKALIEEIRAEASTARRAHRSMKRKRT